MRSGDVAEGPGERASFSFGDNWNKYLNDMPRQAVDRMTAYVGEWLGSDLRGASVIDVGSGQGLTSLVAFRFGATVTSIDVDSSSVAATSRLRAAAGSPATWHVQRGSILDRTLIATLGTFDVVVSWGVLHHTGDMWAAIDAAASLVRPGGRLWIALYHETAHSPRSLRK